MSFRFRKLYADIVTADGTVGVAYLTWLDAWGARVAAAGLEFYTPGGDREVLHARAPDEELDPDRVGDGLRIRLRFPDGEFILAYEHALAGWTPAGPGAHPDLDWRVLIPRARVVGSWAGGAGRPDLVGDGYSDWVDLRRPPRLLRMQALTWGRVHLADSTLVFSAAQFRSGREWRRARCWRDGVGAVDVEPRLDTGGGSLRVQVDENGAGRWRQLTLDGDRVLHRGPGLDSARFPRLWERTLARALTGSLDETRWVSRVVATGTRLDGYRAVHEHVRFGTTSSEKAGGDRRERGSGSPRALYTPSKARFI